MIMDPDIKLMLGVGFVAWCIYWALAVSIMLDRWMWWRKTRRLKGEEE